MEGISTILWTEASRKYMLTLFTHVTPLHECMEGVEPLWLLEAPIGIDF
jgi:hypothetical protein